MCGRAFAFLGAAYWQVGQVQSIVFGPWSTHTSKPAVHSVALAQWQSRRSKQRPGIGWHSNTMAGPTGSRITHISLSELQFAEAPQGVVAGALKDVVHWLSTQSTLANGCSALAMVPSSA